MEHCYTGCKSRGADPAAVVVLAHGIWQSSEMYSGSPLVAKLLERQIAVFMFDFRGFGNSSSIHGRGMVRAGTFEGSYLIDLRAAVEKAAKRFPKLKLFVFGHSLGGLTALLLATSSHARTTALVTGGYVLSAPSIALVPPAKSVFVRWLIQAVGGLLPQLPLRFLESGQSSNNASYVEWWREMQPSMPFKAAYVAAALDTIATVREQFKQLNKPTLMLTGPQCSEHRSPPACDEHNHGGPEDLHEALRGSPQHDLLTFHTLEGAPHELAFESDRRAVQIIVDWILSRC